MDVKKSVFPIERHCFRDERSFREVFDGL